MITNEQKAQEELKKQYAMFRINMVVFWILVNGCYIIFIMNLATAEQVWINAPNHTSTLEGIALYMAGMVVFKVVCGFCHIFRMKWKYNCNAKLAVKRVNL